MGRANRYVVYLDDIREVSKVEQVMKLDCCRQKDTGNTLMELNGDGYELIQHARLGFRVDPTEIRILRFEHFRVNRVQRVLVRDRFIINRYLFSSSSLLYSGPELRRWQNVVADERQC